MSSEAAEPSTLFDLLPIGAYRARPDGRLVRANRALVALSGCASEAELLELVRKSTSTWYVEPGRYEELIARIHRDGSVRGFVSEVTRNADGERIWISENAHALRDAAGELRFYEGTVEEITERIEAARALERSERRLREIAQQVPGMVFRMQVAEDGATRRFSYVSEGVRALYGFGPEAVLADGDLLRRHDHPDDHARVVAEFAASRESGQPVQTVFRIVPLDGGLKWVQLAASPPLADEPGRTRVGVMIDVTARVEAERLRQERDRAEAARKAQAAFLSRVSHELRTPLNAVLGFAQLLQAQAVGDARQQAWIGTILESGRHLLALVNDLLDLSAAQTGRLAMVEGEVDAVALLRECWAAHAMEAARVGIVLVDRLPPVGEAPPTVRADRLRLRQVFDNLLSNALKYNRPRGRVLLQREDAEPGWLAVSVADEGAGLDAAQLERLFQPFDRLGAERRAVAGTGLGLALSNHLVEAMGGRIGVASRPGEGSRFTVTLRQVR